MSLKDRIRNIDGHSSVSNEFRVYTIHGAIVSIITIIIILYLIINEIYYNFQIIYKESVNVNATTSRGLEIEFDITLLNIQCNKLSIDANDIHGQSQSLHLDQKHHIWKHRIKFDKLNGNKMYIGDKNKIELGSTLLKENDLKDIIYDENKIIELDSNIEDEENHHDGSNNNDRKLTEEEFVCGSCYGAGEDGECCDTCEDVKRVYKRRGWILRDIHTIPVCHDEEVAKQNSKENDNEYDKDEGCNIHGIIALSTGGGNLHIAPGRDSVSTGFSILDILLQSFQEWNVTHTIHKIRFGEELPKHIMKASIKNSKEKNVPIIKAATYQLDEQTRVIKDTYGMYQYYIQIVPTTFIYKNGTKINTNQYSVIEHLRHITPGSNRGLPGVFFFYEVSPLHIIIEESYHKGYIAFFTSFCAIIGGVITFMGMFDQFLFNILQKDLSSSVLMK